MKSLLTAISLAAGLLLTNVAPASAAETMDTKACTGDTGGNCHYDWFSNDSFADAAYEHRFTLHNDGPHAVVSIQVDHKTSSKEYDWGGNLLAPPCVGDLPCGQLSKGQDFVIDFDAYSANEHFGDCMQYIEVLYGPGQPNYDIMHLDTCSHHVIDVGR